MANNLTSIAKYEEIIAPVNAILRGLFSCDQIFFVFLIFGEVLQIFWSILRGCSKMT